MRNTSRLQNVLPFLLGLCVALLFVGTIANSAHAQDDDDSVFVPPVWAKPAVDKAANGDLDEALKILDRLAPTHRTSYALPFLQAKVWGEKYVDSHDEAEEIAALKQERRYLLAAKALAKGPQNAAIAAEISSDLTNAERLLRDAGVSLSSPAPARIQTPRKAPSPVRATVAAPRPAARLVVLNTPTQAAKVVKLPPLARRRGYVIGRAIFPDGRPIPDFEISVLGYDGQVNLFSSQGATPSLGWGNGKNGRYAIRTMDTFLHKKPVAGLVVSVQAYAKVKYHGQTYKMPLYPMDGLKDGGNKGEFKGNSGPGVVRDFVLKVSGVKPQFRIYDQAENGDDKGYVFYGGMITLSLTASDDKNYTTLETTAPAGSLITLTLVPQGPLLDGSRGQTIRRTVRMKNGANYYFYLRNIPIGYYTATSTLTTPDGTVTNLRLSKARSNFALSMPLQFDASTSILGGVDGMTVSLVR